MEIEYFSEFLFLFWKKKVKKGKIGKVKSPVKSTVSYWGYLHSKQEKGRNLKTILLPFWNALELKLTFKQFCLKRFGLNVWMIFFLQTRNNLDQTLKLDFWLKLKTRVYIGFTKLEKKNWLHTSDKRKSFRDWMEIRENNFWMKESEKFEKSSKLILAKEF